MNKEQFVKQYLEPLMQNMGENVKSVDYIRKENGEEYVVITYLNDYQKQKCVTGDSLRAIIIDTFKP